MIVLKNKIIWIFSICLYHIVVHGSNHCCSCRSRSIPKSFPGGVFGVQIDGKSIVSNGISIGEGQNPGDSALKSSPLFGSLCPIIPLPGMVIGGDIHSGPSSQSEGPFDGDHEWVSVQKIEEPLEGALRHSTVEVIEENCGFAFVIVEPLQGLRGSNQFGFSLIGEAGFSTPWWSIDKGNGDFSSGIMFVETYIQAGQTVAELNVLLWVFACHGCNSTRSERIHGDTEIGTRPLTPKGTPGEGTSHTSFGLRAVCDRLRLCTFAGLKVRTEKSGMDGVVDDTLRELRVSLIMKGAFFVAAFCLKYEGLERKGGDKVEDELFRFEGGVVEGKKSIAVATHRNDKRMTEVEGNTSLHLCHLKSVSQCILKVLADTVGKNTRLPVGGPP